MSQQQQQQQQSVRLTPRPPQAITYEMRANYFKAPPERPKIKYFVWGGLLVLAIILFHSILWTVIFGICMIPIILRFIRWYQETHRLTMTDEEYDNWIWSHFPEVEQESLRKFRIAQENSAVSSSLRVIRGFVFPKEDDGRLYQPLIYSKQGADGRARSSVSRFFVLLLAEHELCMYIRDLNALGVDCIKKDSTHYYEQIASVEMNTYGIYLGNGEDASKLISEDRFAVTLTSGEKVGVTVVSRDQVTEQTVADLRRLLGQKRYGPQKVEFAMNQNAPQYGGYPPSPYPPSPYPPSPYPQSAPYPPVTGPFPGIGDPTGMPSTYPPLANSYPNTGPFPGSTSEPISAPLPYSTPITPNYASPVASVEQAGTPVSTPENADPRTEQ